ncbi:hypothetical protein RND71_001235 [Anisodus tanguticus]|uniref:Uncharacterized protein n=1 Tax=Anisodus tanguticus TaxID=243964 RepID=A0AAE1VQQ3_9SOLA|nr:hypothetical protein RND71_001235 [Anisodus tanguticus]
MKHKIQGHYIPHATLISTGHSYLKQPRYMCSLRRRCRNGGRLSDEAKQRAKLRKLKKVVKMKNLKLYKENKTIAEENERLRKKALLLHQENKALFSQIIQQVSQPTNIRIN